MKTYINRHGRLEGREIGHFGLPFRIYAGASSSFRAQIASSEQREIMI